MRLPAASPRVNCTVHMGVRSKVSIIMIYHSPLTPMSSYVRMDVYGSPCISKGNGKKNHPAPMTPCMFLALVVYRVLLMLVAGSSRDGDEYSKLLHASWRL